MRKRILHTAAAALCLLALIAPPLHAATDADRHESAILTKMAIAQIDVLQYQRAIDTLDRALLLDRSNGLAAELSIFLREYLIRKGAFDPALLDSLRIRADRRLRALEFKPDGFLLSGSVQYTYAKSTADSPVTSDVSLLGAGLDLRWYFPVLRRMLGVSCEYAGNLLKVGGSDRISFMTHRATASFRSRFLYFEETGSPLAFGLRVSYQMFYLQNLRRQGVYHYVQVYAPAYGIFFSDPLLFHMAKKDALRNLGVEITFDYLTMFWKTGAPSVYQVYAGGYCDYRQCRVALGYELYALVGPSVRELYHGVRFSVGYRR